VHGPTLPITGAGTRTRVVAKFDRSSSILTIHRRNWWHTEGVECHPKSVNKERIETNLAFDGWEWSFDEVHQFDNLKDRFDICRDSWLPVKDFFGDDD